MQKIAAHDQFQLDGEEEAKWQQVGDQTLVSWYQSGANLCISGTHEQLERFAGQVLAAIQEKDAYAMSD